MDLSDGLERGCTGGTEFSILRSIAVSLKRIADMLDEAVGEAKAEEFLTEKES